MTFFLSHVSCQHVHAHVTDSSSTPRPGSGPRPARAPPRGADCANPGPASQAAQRARRRAGQCAGHERDADGTHSQQCGLLRPGTLTGNVSCGNTASWIPE